VSEETGESERVEAVIAEGAGKGGVFIQQLAYAIGPAECRRLEDRELLSFSDSLRFFAVAPVQIL
jgi:hypothetical protein